jgi:hypothetical protein
LRADIIVLLAAVPSAMVVDRERLAQARRNQANIGAAVDRSDPAVARTVIDRLLPDSAARTEVLSTLVRAIEDAHAAKPQSWSVSLFERGVRFNVGQIFALDIVRDAALVVLDAPTLSAATLADLDDRVQPFEIKKLPNLCACFVFHDEHSRWSGALADASRAAIHRAAGRAKAASQRWEAHSSGVLEYLREEGRQVPTPEYEIVRLPPVPRETVLAAMRDFIDDRVGRGLGEWRPTGQHRYAIEHEGRHYPVKEIVTRVTGQPRGAFTGGPQANNYAKSLGFDVVKLDPSRSERRVWWVNQGDSYEGQRDEGCLWAPLVDAGGQRQRYWETLREVGEDDLFVHFHKGHIRAIGRAAADAEDTAGPGGERGRGVDVEYFELPRPIPVEQVRVAVQELAIDEGPLDQSGQVKQAYLFYRVVAVLQELLGPPATADRPRAEALGLVVPWDLEVRWTSGIACRYNARFAAGAARSSYSLPLRPDIVVEIPTGSAAGLHLFDAKFRVELIRDLGDDVDDVEVRGPVRDTLYKMHTYRDAIVDARTVRVLYPGNEEVFYPQRNGCNFDGIGAVPLTPTSGVAALRTVLEALVG